MNRVNHCIIVIAVCFVSMIWLLRCDSNTGINDSTDVSTIYYNKKEDFQSITIGKSTFQDVYEIASPESMQVTSYGGVCEYPMQNGGYVRVKLYGKDLIVGDIEEVSQSIKGQTENSSK
jgi:hypothetical protein